MDMIVDFPKNLRVDAHFGGQTISTDQPVRAGGGDSAPEYTSWDFVNNAVYQPKIFELSNGCKAIQ